MTIQQLNKELGNIDIYLLDQILKGKINQNARILDAGCGEGRNMMYFLNNQYNIQGIDQNPDAIRMLQFIVGSAYPSVSKSNFIEGELDQMPYDDQSLDYIICSAVLHFAKSELHFWMMMDELNRTLSPNGTIFIRMTSDIGLIGHHETSQAKRYLLPDTSVRYLINETDIQTMKSKYKWVEIEPIKTVLVDSKRAMTTLVFNKKG